MAQVEPNLIRYYLVQRTNDGLRESSVHAAYRAVRAFMNFCAREGLVAESPMKRIGARRVVRPVLPAFSEEDIRRLLAACRLLRDRALLLFLLDTGCRLSEAVNIKENDLDFQSGEVTVRRSKGGRPRSVYIRAETRQLLREYLNKHGAGGKDGAVWRSETSGKALTASGVQLFTPLRRSSATQVSRC